MIATQNPAEYIATHSLSEAVLDRFESLQLDYQTREEEIRILERSPVENGASPAEMAEMIVDLIRRTREDERLERGASIRAGLSLLRNLMKTPEAASNPEAMATLLEQSLKNRLKFHGDRQTDFRSWCRQLLIKKKSN